jgi:hypothetical protein
MDIGESKYNESKANEVVCRISGSLALSGCVTSPKQKDLMLDIILGRTDVEDATRKIFEKYEMLEHRII